MIFLPGETKLTGGTTVLVILTNDNIWIAADSKNVTTVKGETVSSRFINKINHRRYIFFTVIGGYMQMNNEKDETVFDSTALIAQAIDDCDDFNCAFDTGMKLLITKLNELFAIMPPYLQQEFINQEGRKLLEIVMITNDKKGPLIKLGDIGIKKNDDFFEFFCYEHELEVNQVYKFGHKEEVTKAIRDPEFEFDPENIHQDLVELIQLEAEANPDKVGGPVDVLLINKDGPLWLTNNEYK